MKYLKTENALNSQTMFYLSKGSYSSLVVQFSVVAAAATLLTKSDFGSLIININGKDIVNTDIEFLNRLNNIQGGYADFSSITAGDAKMFVSIPFSFNSEDKNILDIDETDRALIKLDFATLTSKIVSGSVSVFGVLQTGVQNYIYNIMQRPLQVSGAGIVADSYLIENVSNMFLLDASAALVSNVQISKDNDSLIDAPAEVLKNETLYKNRVESDEDFIKLDFVNSNDVREAVSKSVGFNYTFLMSGTLKQYFSFLTFDNAKTISSYYKTKFSFDSKNKIDNVSKPLTSLETKNKVD